MGLLENLFGGGQRQEYEDFVNRYDQGPPWQGISDQEAFNRYQQVAPQLPPDVYQQSAHDAFSRMAPQERVQLGQVLQQQARQQGYMDPAWDEDDNLYQDPGYLAQVTGRLHQQQPGMLGQLLGGGGGGGLQGTVAKAALAGVAAMATKRMLGGR